MHHQHRIHSIDCFDIQNESISKLFLSIDSSYNRLQSISFFEIPAKILIRLLHQYSSLPRLFSFNIDINDCIMYKQMIEIYQLIFSQSKLKSLRLSTLIDNELVATLPLSIATKEQYTHIQYLYLDHCMDLNELFSIISYTPELSKLIVTLIIDTKWLSVKDERRISLFNLKYFSIKVYESDLDELEEFFLKTNCRLDIFHILIMHRSGNYHNIYQWQRFIRRYLSYLKTFTIIFHESNKSQSEILNDTLQFKQFWSHRLMNFCMEISPILIKHTISPYRYDNKQINSPMKVCFTNFDMEKSFSLIITHIQQISLNTIINHLDIKHISLNKLMKLLNSLPELHSLKISSLLINRNDVIEKQRNQITKLFLRKLNNIKQIDLLLEIFPRMIYFILESTKNINIYVCFRYIINKIKMISNQQLRIVCIHVCAADDQMITILQTMIESEKLLFDYSIRRMLNYIYVQWK